MFEFIFPIVFSLHVQPVRIAVIDSGYNTASYTFNLCGDSLNLTTVSMAQASDHGQNVNHLIAKNMKYVDYCIIPIKIFDTTKELKVADLHRALVFAREKKADVVNLSISGGYADRREMDLISDLLDHGAIVVAAAGNDHKDLDKDCDTYPACDDPRVVIVGSVNKHGVISKFSNYGKKVTIWANGEQQTAGGITYSGTSQATPQITAKFANKIIFLRRKYEQSK